MRDMMLALVGLVEFVLRMALALVLVVLMMATVFPTLMLFLLDEPFGWLNKLVTPVLWDKIADWKKD